MCGIAGFTGLTKGSVKRDAVLFKMSEQLKNRGPDEEGVYLSDSMCLIHRRLVVIDPAGGKQPMTRCCRKGSFTLVYNGELYNTQELRRELEEKGYSFFGHSDTEVLLNGYLEWGEQVTEKLNGIFAFAVCHQETGSLFLARDRGGVKPLFYAKTRDGFAFASELKALLCHPDLAPVLDREGARQLFLLGPARKPGSGVFRGIQELRPGECLTWKDGEIHTRFYWKLTPRPHTEGMERTMEQLRFLLTDAIRRQLVSDVPLCTLLSGGLDSSIISAVAAAEYRRQGKVLTTYSVDYRDNDRYFTADHFQPGSDDQYIDIMREFIGSRHKKVVLGNTQLAYALIPAVAARDLPGMADIDSSMLLFCREIKKDFTVAVSGECADELFGGYPWYFDKVALESHCFPWSPNIDVRRQIARPEFCKDGEEYLQAEYRDTLTLAEGLEGESPEDKRMREMFVLNYFWFMQTLLERKDRMSMACGLEVRVPFCDHRVVEYAYNLPWQLKSLGGREKGLLRKAMEPILPPVIAKRKKSPYPKTHHPEYFAILVRWMRQILKDPSSPVLALIDPEGVTRLMEHPEQMTYPMYGQLMKAPQVLAWLIQLNDWLKRYDVVIAC